LAQLLADAADGRFEPVAVYRWDRLARDTTLDGFLRYRLKQLGVSVISATEENGRDPVSEMTQSILAAVAQYERHLIKQRLISARQLKKSRGGYAAGRPRFGMKAVGGMLAADECETEAIELARKLRRRKKTYREIAQILADSGFVAKSARQWSLGTLHNMLNRRATKKRTRIAM
jgi:site-specific DNA recombinase